MMFVILALVLGIVLYLVPSDKPPGGKVNTLGLVLIFWSVFFVMAAYGGKTVRVAGDARGCSGFAASSEGKKPEQRAASESSGPGRLREGFSLGQHI
jgi:hypothetical protein